MVYKKNICTCMYSCATFIFTFLAVLSKSSQTTNPLLLPSPKQRRHCPPANSATFLTSRNSTPNLSTCQAAKTLLPMPCPAPPFLLPSPPLPLPHLLPFSLSLSPTPPLPKNSRVAPPFPTSVPFPPSPSPQFPFLTTFPSLATSPHPHSAPSFLLHFVARFLTTFTPSGTPGSGPHAGSSPPASYGRVWLKMSTSGPDSASLAKNPKSTPTSPHPQTKFPSPPAVFPTFTLTSLDPCPPPKATLTSSP